MLMYFQKETGVWLHSFHFFFDGLTSQANKFNLTILSLTSSTACIYGICVYPLKSSRSLLSKENARKHILNYNQSDEPDMVVGLLRD